jgi:hypothetical protein
MHEEVDWSSLSSTSLFKSFVKRCHKTNPQQSLQKGSLFPWLPLCATALLFIDTPSSVTATKENLASHDTDHYSPNSYIFWGTSPMLQFCWKIIPELTNLLLSLQKASHWLWASDCILLQWRFWSPGWCSCYLWCVFRRCLPPMMIAAPIVELVSSNGIMTSSTLGNYMLSPCVWIFWWQFSTWWFCCWTCW